MNIKHFPRKIKRRVYMINIKKNILLVYIWDTKHNTGISWYILHEWWIQILVNIYTCIVYKNFQQHLRWPQKLYRSSTLMIMQHITEVNKSTSLLAWSFKNIYGTCNKFTLYKLFSFDYHEMWYSSVLICFKIMFTNKQHFSNRIEKFHKLYITCMYMYQYFKAHKIPLDS